MDHSILEEYSEYDISYKIGLILGTIILIGWLKWLWSRRNFYKYSWNIPGPFSFPIIGVAHLLMGQDSAGLLNVYRKYSNMYPDIAKFWFGPKLYFNIGKPEYIEKLLTHPNAIDKDKTGYRFLAEVLGTGMLTSKGNIWKPRRKIVASCMSQNILNSYVEIFTEYGTEFVNILKELLEKKDIKWTSLTTKYSLKSFCKTGLGIDLDTLNEASKGVDLATCLRIITDLGSYRFMTLPYHLDSIWALSPSKKIFDMNIKAFHEINTTFVKNKRQQFQKLQKHEMEEFTKRNSSFLDLLMLHSNLPDEDLIDEVKTFTAAAIDTTGIAICIMFMMLALYPEVQQKVYEEIIDVIGYDRGVEPSDLPLFKYMERVIKEVFRLFPPVTGFSRNITTNINLGDITLPKDSSIVICPHIIHRRPENFNDPLKFDPDRFLPEEVQKRHPCTYIPFSYGQRNCIGFQYAMMSLKTVTALVIRELEPFTDYTSIEEFQIKMEPVLEFSQGIKLWFKARNPN